MTHRPIHANPSRFKNCYFVPMSQLKGRNGMKLIFAILLLMIALPVVAKTAVVPQNIDDAFLYRFEEEPAESKRGVASGEDKVEPSDEEVEILDDPDRNPSAQEIQKQSQGLRYWKWED